MSSVKPTKRRVKRKKTPEQRAARLEQQQQEIQSLQDRIDSETPARGAVPTTDESIMRAFRSLPLSQTTLKGLEQAEFTRLTKIQDACIPHALAGRDILGAARTGR
jgi:ATP-dependent RNA helicase DDX10/DBP4